MQFAEIFHFVAHTIHYHQSQTCIRYIPIPCDRNSSPLLDDFQINRDRVNPDTSPFSKTISILPRILFFHAAILSAFVLQFSSLCSSLGSSLHLWHARRFLHAVQCGQIHSSGSTAQFRTSTQSTHRSTQSMPPECHDPRDGLPLLPPRLYLEQSRTLSSITS